MKIIVKIKAGCEDSSVENFGAGRYLVKLMSQLGDADATEEFYALMTRKLGSPRSKFEFIGKDANGDRVFEVR